jgi:uncharacterized protein
MVRLEPLLPKSVPVIDWDTTMAARWQSSSQGRGGHLLPINARLDQANADLLNIDRQRELLAANTRQFVMGMPANHALLWGARGTGKSSLIRALLAQYAAAGLRLIEVERDDLAHLPQIVAQLIGQAQYFILFCDDLSFESGEGQYRVLKTVLDGSLERTPDNVLLYATSNRRHMVPEHQSDNSHWQMVDGELHPSEAVEDKIALSDRFGLWLSFYPFSQSDYLAVVRRWLGSLAERSGLEWAWDEALEKEAISWATARGNRNGRCAHQFAKQWVGSRLLNKDQKVGQGA